MPDLAPACGLPDDVHALFTGANIAHLATVLPDGAPHSVPVWVGVEGDLIAFLTAPGSRKARNIARDPRVAHVYTGAAYPLRQDRVAFLVHPDSAFTLGY